MLRAVRSRTNADALPVVIVGGGVVGISTAVALARHGVESVVLDRRPFPNPHPRAHVANPRTMEILRLWGVEPAIRKEALAANVTGNFVWLESIAGPKLGWLDYRERRDGPERHAVTLAPEVSCAQDVIERILRERLLELTGTRVKYDAEVVDVSPTDEDLLAVTVAGEKEPRLARYVIASDGAWSTTREGLGIAMEGPDELARFASIYLYADLSPWTDAMPAVLYWIVNQEVQGLFISMDGQGRYVFHIRIDPSRQSFEDFTVDYCRELVLAAVGSDVDVDIRDVGNWIMSGQVAERYRQGNVFLAGDSAHRFPPTGGFGMNTGVQDAHNLAWKLAAVMSGWAGDQLLDSYQPERRPVADANRTRSVSNFLRLESLASWAADPAPILERLRTPGEVGLAERQRFADEIERQRDHFDKVEQELGFVYGEGAAISAAGSDKADTHESGSGLSRMRVGGRFPLIQMRTPDGNDVGSTDLFEHGFVLFTSAGSAWNPGVVAARDAGVPITMLEIGTDLLLDPQTWADFSEIEPSGAILVRPDGHVAYQERVAPQDPEAALQAALKRILSGEHVSQPV
jgi:2-polyprenyl-6-methoxyphenol hydroxylase-like FAD-dependent oxidoreductase